MTATRSREEAKKGLVELKTGGNKVTEGGSK